VIYLNLKYDLLKVGVIKKYNKFIMDRKKKILTFFVNKN
jgi:hypothetical protein